MPLSRGTLLSRSLQRPKSEAQGSELAVRPPCCPEELELHHFMVTAAEASLEFHIPHQPLLVGANNRIDKFE